MFCNIYCITLESERCLLHLRVPCCSICFPKVAQWGSVLCCLTKTRIMQLVHVQERGAFVLLFVELCSETPPPPNIITKMTYQQTYIFGCFCSLQIHHQRGCASKIKFLLCREIMSI